MSTATTTEYQTSESWEEIKDECPVCHHKGHCRRSPDGATVNCRREAQGGKEKQYRDGSAYYVHHLRGRPGPSGRSKPKSKGQRPKAANADTLGEAYGMMLGLMELSVQHRADLKKRGLSDEAIDCNKYRSLGSKFRTEIAGDLVKKFGLETMRTVPGFKVNKHGVPTIGGNYGMVIPCRDTQGRVGAIKIRVDVPGSGGKYVYLTSRTKDNPDGVSPGSPIHVPLGTNVADGLCRVTEGPLKADVTSALSGVPTISIPGVDSWKKAIPVLKELGARTVRLAFDADARTNPKVGGNLLRFATALQAEGFAIEYEHWDAVDGKGIDDLIVSGKTPEIVTGPEAMEAIRATANAAGVEATKPADPLALSRQVHAIVEEGGFEALYRNAEILTALAAAPIAERGAIEAELKKHRKFSVRMFEKILKQYKRSEKGEKHVARATYDHANGGFVIVGRDEEGNEILTGLTNFVAWISVEERRDNGDDVTARFKIKGLHKDDYPLEADVPAKEFGSLAWIHPLLGANAIIDAGPGIKDHVRVAIQGWKQHERTVKTIHTHTGWKQHRGEWFYLHAGGAIGGDGLDPCVLVDLSEHGLSGFELPDPPTGDQLRTAVRASLEITRLGRQDRPQSRSVAALILTLPYRSVFGSVRFGVQFNGPTGSHKTCAAALAQQHFGSGLDYKNLPAGFNSTTNALQAIRHALADSLLVVDDFVPSGSRQEREKATSAADDLYRTQGNGQGRRRMNVDGTLRPPMDPKSGLLTTGEERPARASANLRTLGAWFEKDDDKHGSLCTIDKHLLGLCQADADAGLYAACMAAFLRWVAPRFPELRDGIPQRAAAYRKMATQPGDHGRTPDIVADLAAGFDLFLDFAIDSGAISVEEEDHYRHLVWDGLMDSSTAMREEMSEQSDPAQRFLTLIGSAMTTRSAYLVNSKTGNAPESDDWLGACGWLLDLKYNGEIGQVPFWVHGPNARQIGWISEADGMVYLDPMAAYSEAQKLMRDHGETLPPQASLVRLLDSGHKLAEKDSRKGEKRLTSRKTLGKQQRNVWAIKASEFWPDKDERKEDGPTMMEATA